MRKSYGYFIGFLNFVVIVVIFHYIGKFLPFFWTSPDEIARFTDIEKLDFRNTQSFIQLIGYLVAAYVATRSYRKVVGLKNGPAKSRGST